MRIATQGNRGDTIIEVLFATAIFAMVSVGAIVIMNRGVATAQRSLEVTQVRQQMDAQAEAIRFIHDSYVESFRKDSVATGTAAEWVKMTNPVTGKGAANASTFGIGTGDTKCPANAPGEKPFVLNTHTASVWGTVPPMFPPSGMSTPPFAQVVYNPDSSIATSYGIWVEAVPSSTGVAQAEFVDFHIRACWDSAASVIPVTLGTIVRLYEPR